MDVATLPELRHDRRIRQRWGCIIACLLGIGLPSCGTGAPAIADDAALVIFQQLHSQIYDVYGLAPERDDVYDLLRTSFDGEALLDEYVEHYTTLRRMQRDDTKVTILRVDYGETQVLDNTEDGVVIEADWNVGGVVYHQGHSHTRINRYQAIYTLAERDPGYRIVDTKMKNMERVQLDLMTSSLGLDEPLPTTGQGMLSPSDMLRAGLKPEDFSRPAADDDSADPGDGEESP